MDANKENVYFTDEEIAGFNVTALQNYLRQHGQYVTGKKSDLVERAKGVRKLHLKDINELDSNDLAWEHIRRAEKLVTPLGEKIPEPSSLKDWTSDVTNIPKFSDSEIYNYLVLTMKAKRQFRSKVYYEDRHVHSLQFHPVSEECSHCVVRCKVIPSLPTSNKKENPDHTVWVCLSKVSGKVHSADCNCTAGTGEACNHIAAVLYALEDVTAKKLDGSPSSTSQKCKWNNPRKRKLSPSKVQNMNFIKQHHHIKKDTSVGIFPTDEFKPTLDINRFKDKLLKADSKVGWLTFFESKKICSGNDEHRNNCVPQLHDVNYLYHDSVDLGSEKCLGEFQNRFDNMKVTENEVLVIEEKTRGQVKNDQWHKARHERITSSKFGNVCKMHSHTQPNNNLCDILGYREFRIKYCKWGIKHEPAARRVYSNFIKNENMKVETCGLIVNTKYPHLGASPDGLVTHMEQSDKSGLLEIKCPAAERWRNLHPCDCAKHSDFYCNFDACTDSVKLKHSHNYYYQIQGQMLIAERQWCDFVVWTLKGWTVERIYVDSDFCEKMLKRLNSFYLNFVLPEIFSERVKRGRNLKPLLPQ